MKKILLALLLTLFLPIAATAGPFMDIYMEAEQCDGFWNSFRTGIVGQGLRTVQVKASTGANQVDYALSFVPDNAGFPVDPDVVHVNNRMVYRSTLKTGTSSLNTHHGLANAGPNEELVFFYRCDSAVPLAVDFLLRVKLQ